MTIQKKRITESVNYILPRNPFKDKIDLALITYYNPAFLKLFKIRERIGYEFIPPGFESEGKDDEGELIFAEEFKTKRKLLILNGRFHYYNGYTMRETAHYIYILKALGVKTVILVGEAGHLNPRFQTGGVSFIYDHINLMGDNPLIGENDDSLGPRFPDMSNAYDKKLYTKAEHLLIENKFRFYPSVYLGIPGPETETEAECRFYRDIGADVLGYSLVPENIAAVHAGLKVIAFGMITRELVADRLVEISEEEKNRNRLKAEKEFGKILPKIVGIL
jgi:purine-nucleoside phosphorylase